ncbi:hypothetical protein [Tunturiibacter lichenicola]|uniref:hypothetical protein n=1 Tax=Tunturiibacter lichenicola TaxID=2051959 RepID=UPI003D9B1763
MTIRSWAVRIVLFAGGLFLSLVLIAFLIVQIQLTISRWRAERLSADMHQIRLYQTTWADAQSLMHRWGAWGHYDGTCTAASCQYVIRMGTIRYSNPDAPKRAWVDWLSAHDRLNLYQWLGGRDVMFYASFTVHDGTIWRTGSGISVEVPTRRIRRENDWPLGLSISAVSRQRLHRTIEDPFSYMYSEDELAQHPYYKVGRPGGCKINCQFEIVYYSTHTPPAEIERLTSYNFTCFTRLIACAHIDDLLPASKEWHLYDEYQSSSTVPILPPCSSIPVWAHARDIRYALAIEVLPTIADDKKYDPRKTNVQVVTSLKEPAPWLPGAIVPAYSYGSGYIPPEKGQELVPGKRFIVFPVGNDERHDILTKESPIKLDRCGVLEDTPALRRELERGFAQNDTLRP